MVEPSKTSSQNTPELITITREEYNKLRHDNLYLHQELEKLKRIIFGAKSERFIPSDNNQLSLELGQQPKEIAVKEEEISYVRVKGEGNKGHGRPQLPAHLHRQEIILEPAEDVNGAVKIGEVVTEVLEYEPGKVFVKRYIRPKYAIKTDEGTTVAIADLPSLPIPRGNVSASLLAFILVSKFVDHLPFYRQRQILKRLGIDIAESTINDWFREGCDVLEQLYQCLKQKILSAEYLMVDETPLPVQTDDKPGATHKGYHWVYYNPLERLVLFDYRKSRGREGPDEMLKDFKGALQTDGYSAYDVYENKPGITLLACMAHARRKFDEAKKNDKSRAEYVLTEIQKLYAIEQQARSANMDAGQRKALRLEKAKPVMDQLKAWLMENVQSTLPQSAIGKAMQYTLGLWPRLERYLKDGKYEIDNNLVENSIRPIALGRKNYLFAGSHEAAQRAAMVYSLLGSCKKNDIDPLDYLTKLFTRLPDHSIQRLEELLPRNLC